MQNRYGIPSKQILRVADGSSESLRKLHGLPSGVA
jgi:hypothetical protein